MDILGLQSPLNSQTKKGKNELVRQEATVRTDMEQQTGSKLGKEYT